ncbi:myomesin-3 [Thalassophryne amazonica]|uniref:myomesin-3 n=1 Tax=Thalassophryne amazonica TaxID=390379 RepID=UPI0014709B58|nr:myomesin-3 [Thalassophryne amazonica]
MESTTVTQRVQEEQSSRMLHSMKLSSESKKKTFKSSEEEASYSDFYPIISADLMSVKELLDIGTFPHHRTWKFLMETMVAEEYYHRNKWTLFGNEAEKVELDVIRNQHMLRTRMDKLALRKKAQEKAAAHIKYLERLSQKAPDFWIPLRAHTVWEGMTVNFTCTVKGCPPPRVTWYKNGKQLRLSDQPWNYSLRHDFGIHSLEIRRCSPDDAGEYKVVAKSRLGEASTFATLVVNSYHGALAGLDHSQTYGTQFEQEALFDTTFPPTWVTEGHSLTLECTFTSALQPFQQDISWFRDGVQLHQSNTVEIQTTDKQASITLNAVYKEYEGVYTVRVKTRDGVQEHSTFVYVRDASAAVLGGPASPLSVKVSDINKNYVFLTWEPPSADGMSPVCGYYVERCDLSNGKWVRCNEQIQKMCHYPVFGLKEGAMYQFQVRAINQAGTGRPSKASDPVLTEDPLKHTRTMVVSVGKGRTITITKDELEGHVKVPSPPTNVHPCEVSDTYVVLSWTEPEPRGREPLSFDIEWTLAGKNSWELINLDMEVQSPRFPVYDLVKGQYYCFRVRAINKYGISEPSEPSRAITLGDAQVVPAPPHSVLAIRDTDTSVLLQWKEPKEKDDILGYYLYYCEKDKQDWETVNNKPVTQTRFTVHGLKTGREYVFRVKSVSLAGNSDYSDESQPILVKSAIYVPSRPSAIALLLCTGSEMVLSWRAPKDDGGAPVRGYYLEQRQKDTDTWREVNIKPVKERQVKVCNLTTGHYYEFRVFAANMVGVGKPSEASDAFLCEKWTMPEPGCPYDVEIRDVRHDSLVLMWSAPMYEGQSPVTGYLLEISQGDQSDNWTAVNDQPITDMLYKVTGLQAGQTYRLRVSAVNKAGPGCASLPSEPIRTQTDPDKNNIEIGVDDDGFIFLSYETDETTDKSKCLWSKDYREPIDDGRTRVESDDTRSILIFNDPSEEDLGLYTVEMSDNPKQSSSYDFTAEDLERLKELSWKVKNPPIALKSGWQVEVSENGTVRLWLQTESLSNDAELRLIFNDREISSTPHRTINFDKAKGLVEILFDQLSEEDEGSYTAQLKDGRAKSQFTLVFVDEKFHQAWALADAKRREHQRKLGPHFLEFLSWSVNEDCEVIIKCKVTNTNKDTTLEWFKDGVTVKEAEYDKSSGLSSLTVSQVTKSEAGSYTAVVADGRGKDVSTLELRGEDFDKVLQELSNKCALSAGPLRIQCTAEGFRLYCLLKYYISYLKTSWHFKEKKIDQETRAKPGSSMQKVWIDIFNPTENDRGKYTLEMFDGKQTHKRYLDLSGQAFADAFQEYQRLKQIAITEKNRARVVKGLPDVVAIMEGKSLCLTCFVAGDPDPEVFWLRNDKELHAEGQFNMTKERDCSTITVNNINVQNSGKYSILVHNKYGSDTVDVTVSVYKCGDKPPVNAVLLG